MARPRVQPENSRGREPSAGGQRKPLRCRWAWPRRNPRKDLRKLADPPSPTTGMPEEPPTDSGASSSGRLGLRGSPLAIDASDCQTVTDARRSYFTPLLSRYNRNKRFSDVRVGPHREGKRTSPTTGPPIVVRYASLRRSSLSCPREIHVSAVAAAGESSPGKRAAMAFADSGRRLGSSSKH